MMRKSLFLTLIFLLVLSNFALPSSASVFQDTHGHWAEKAIDRWSEREVLNGYGGAFRPDESITRAEFSTIVDNIMKYQESGNNEFADIAQDDWYFDAMVKLHTAGVLQGSAGKALPDQQISRQEAAVLIARAFRLEGGKAEMPFTDQGSIADWALEAVHALASNQVLNGRPDGSFDPSAPLSRAEAATIFSNLIAELYTAPGEYSGDVNGNVVVNADGVVLKDMKIAGNLYVTQGVGEGEVTLDGVEIEGTVFVEGGGENSVIFNNVTVKGALVVKKYNGMVRILATGSTSVSVTTLESGALVVARELTGGGFEKIEIAAEVMQGQRIVLDGNFNTVVNRSQTAEIVAEGNIREFVAEVDTNITGNVTIDKMTVAEGANAAVNDKPVSESGQTPVIGGGSSGGGGGGSRTVSVTGVSIQEGDITLSVGESKQLTATVQPSNATNQNVRWEVADGSADVITVDANGLVTALAPGTKAVKVTTEDGGKTDEVEVQVLSAGKQAFTFEILKYEGDAAAVDAPVSPTVIANSSKLQVEPLIQLPYGTNEYEVLVAAQEPLAAAGEEEQLHGTYANLIVVLKDASGHRIADPNGFDITVTGATYTLSVTDEETGTVTKDTYDVVPEFGTGLADGWKDGSFVFLINAGDPEAIQQFGLSFSHENYADAKLSIVYVPSNTAYITGIEPIAGENKAGSELTAGNVVYRGTPASQELKYRWMRADQADGQYELIEGAEGPAYLLTERDSGKYIRVEAVADQVHAAGRAISEPVGPVGTIAKAEEVFAALEEVFLGENTSLSSITSDLNLIESLEAFPDVTINWESSDETVVTKDGKVTRSQSDDQFVTLTATLNGVTGTNQKQYQLIVRALGTDQVQIDEFIDPYFADDYPQAYMKDGTVWVRFKLRQPAEVFMIVNAINGHIEADVHAVLEGRAGKGNHMVYVDQWPYFHVTDADRVYEFDTGVALDEQDTRVEFVIRDQGNHYISEDVTSIVFDQEVFEYVDTYPPNQVGAFVNDALDAIYVHYSEQLDLNSVPSASEFALNHGQVERVTLHNYEDRFVTASYVKLDVSGITDAVKEDLYLSYQGTSIRDTSLDKNPARTFNNMPVTALHPAAIEEVVLSSDRAYMTIRMSPGLNRQENPVGWREVPVTIRVNGNEITDYRIIHSSYSITDYDFTIQFHAPLPEGDVSVAADVSGFYNFALDPYGVQATSQSVDKIPAPGTPEAVYEPSGELRLTFAEGYRFNSRGYNAAGFVIQSDGKEYELRGYIVHPSENVLHIWLTDEYSSHFRNAIEHGSNVQLKYIKKYEEGNGLLSDAAGALLPGFGYVPVRK